jgi:protein-arginine kinase activator protein McsA
VCQGCLARLLQKRVALPLVLGLDGQGFDLQECPGCGMQFENVVKGGLFGCPSCYSSFNKFAATVLANDSGSGSRQ